MKTQYGDWIKLGESKFLELGGGDPAISYGTVTVPEGSQSDVPAPMLHMVMSSQCTIWVVPGWELWMVVGETRTEYWGRQEIEQSELIPSWWSLNKKKVGIGAAIAAVALGVGILATR